MKGRFPAEHSIGEYACKLLLITEADKEDDVQLLEKLKSIKQNLKKATKRKIASDDNTEEIKKKYPEHRNQQEMAVQTQSCTNVKELSSQTNTSQGKLRSSNEGQAWISSYSTHTWAILTDTSSISHTYDSAIHVDVNASYNVLGLCTFPLLPMPHCHAEKGQQ